MATVRTAREADTEQVHALLVDAGLPLDGLDSAWLTLVAEDGAELCAVTALERYDSADGPVFLLRSVAVRAELRGTGLGRELVTAALEATDRDAGGLATIGLLTDTANGYFNRFGFIPVDLPDLPPTLSSSAELQGACPDTARSYLRG